MNRINMRSIQMRTFCLPAAMALISLTASAEFLPIKVTPEDGSTVEKLSKIVTNWPGEWLENQTNEICGIVKDENGTEITTLTCEIDFMDPICDFYLDEPVTDKGSYTVTIYAGSVLSDEDEWNSQFELHYTIGEVAVSEPLRFIEADPANFSVLSSLSQIETTWSETVAAVNTDLIVEVLDASGLKVGEMEVHNSIFTSPTAYLSLPSPLEKDGLYTIMLPEGLLTTENGAKSEATELTYTIVKSSDVRQTTQAPELIVTGNSVTYLGDGTLCVHTSDGRLVLGSVGKNSFMLSKGVYLITITENAEKKVTKIFIN